jgi:thiamine-phosphate pyrophosphorylase
MQLPALYAVIDAEACARAGREPLALAEAFLAGGATLMQWRAKHLPAGPSLETAERLVNLSRTTARLVVNDRADVAVLSGAAGVHLGQDDQPVADARAVMGDRTIVGLSTHTIEQVRQALALPVSYIAVGPVYGTATKDTGYEAVGLSLVEEARRAIGGRVPLVAIGGITLDRAPEVLAAGADSVCVISDLLIGDPRDRVARFLERCGQP